MNDGEMRRSLEDAAMHISDALVLGEDDKGGAVVNAILLLQDVEHELTLRAFIPKGRRQHGRN